jgi:hypothetical protein
MVRPAPSVVVESTVKEESEKGKMEASSEQKSNPNTLTPRFQGQTVFAHGARLFVVKICGGVRR